MAVAGRSAAFEAIRLPLELRDQPFDPAAREHALIFGALQRKIADVVSAVFAARVSGSLRNSFATRAV